MEIARVKFPPASGLKSGAGTVTTPQYTVRLFPSAPRVSLRFPQGDNSGSVLQLRALTRFVTMPFLSPARRSQPLGEYCVRRAMHRDHDSGDPGWLAFLYCLRIDRNRADCTYRLVRMDLAEASGTLTLQTFFFRSNISRPRRRTELNHVTQMTSRTLAENSRSTRPVMRITSICEEQPASVAGGTKNESAPDSLSHGAHRLNSPPPKSAQFQINLCPKLRK